MTRDLWLTALQFAEAGIGVFPLSPGTKVPMAGSRGVTDATTSVAQVHDWSRQYPEGNYGVACGGSRNLYVLDFDQLDAIAPFTELYGERPPTPTVRTPRPGRHEYFLAPAGAPLRNTAGRLLNGVDTRGQAGYVVGPGSVLADGRDYAWQVGLSPADVDFAPLPDSILEALWTPKREPAAPYYSVPQPEPDLTRRVAAYLRKLPSLRDGDGRNQAAYRLASFVLNDCDGGAADAMAALHVWNGRNIEPLGDARLASILSNAQRYGAAS